ncbi:MULTISPECIES: serine/threonine protein kinase [unclassified Streptomyces]|uniref:serine/threonine protein kinase n=1 Tax=unclassified Streptomyces TaxID=2593676 RepID=UPI0006AFDDAF|nr:MULTISPECIES: serine/threonine protein kinase [unclassified Streptomyces]KOU84729.1 serine/threonine protein kinase [Streptomyces sp. XY58]KOV04921.1 serine/threonine protein kinase [Streptomyces sp. XY37]KOV47066.1 serine/threonine protein kinase [Streptomyces sp. MMG1064]
MSMIGAACVRPGCPGSYEDMGGGELYCDTCGLAPVGSIAAGAEELVSPPTGMTSAARGSLGSGGSRASHGSHGSQGSQGSHGSARSSASARSSRSSSSRRSVSGRLSRSLTGQASTRSVSVRSSGSAASSSGRSRLGAGLVNVPEVPRPDPSAAVLENPEVPERKRFCSRSDCGAPVGRARGDRPGRTEGFCTKCGHPYSFVPKLRAGEVVRGQYEVAGCLAHGGLGWVYLAVDRAVADRWVVLKGLLDTGDHDAMEAAISERRFLAEIEHSNIVRIYNFVEHLDQRTGSLDGYIVMEYVGGKSLKEIANERRRPDGRRDPLPVEQACAYGIEALEALGHLHSRNLLYCDFKVDNAIQQQDQLKLIDMGAVRRMDDEESAIYGTVGYQAPEVAELGPSVASDLYTVARTLAVLTFDFQGYTNVFVDSLPDPEHIEVFRRYESFYRLLVRATDPDPGRRFASAQEMADQLTGVLREVVALQTGRPRPQLSTLFGPELRVPDTLLFTGTDTPDTVVSRLGHRTVASRPFASRRGGGLLGLVGRGPARPAAAAPGRAGVPTPSAAAATSGPQGHTPPTGLGLPGTAPGGAPGTWASAAGGAAASGGTPGTWQSAVGGGGLGTTATHVAGAAVPRARQAPAAGPGPVASPPAPASAPVAAATVTTLDARETALALPVPLVDAADPNAGFLTGLLASAPADLLGALASAPADSAELRLRELRARLELGELSAAGDALAELEARHPDDWRVVWARGIASLATGDDEIAALSFDAIYDAFPGEPAPKLALGLCAEVLGQLDNAAEYYRLVWITDPGFVSAAFGLARVQLAAGDRGGAVRTLESVPEASIHYTAARVAAVRARLRDRSPDEPLLADLSAAADQVEALRRFGLDPERQESLATEVLGSALDWVLSGSRGADPGRTSLLGSQLDERGLRFGLERSYRVLARLARRGEERIELVERANRFRPRTWV